VLGERRNIISLRQSNQ